MLDTHEHFRPGTDCGMCGPEVCPAFSPQGSRRGAPAPASSWWSRLVSVVLPGRRAV